MKVKSLLKIFSVFVVVAGLVSCSNTRDDLKYQPEVESGWVQFLENAPSTVGAFQGAQGSLTMDVNVQVPTTTRDLTINYEMVPVSGEDPNGVFSNDGMLIAPAGETSYMGPDNNTGFEYAYLHTIELDLEEVANIPPLTEPMIFDVVLTGTNSPMITAGAAGLNFPISTRVVINPSLAGFEGTYDVSEQFTSGPNAPFGLGDFFGESYQIELAPLAGDTTASKFVVNNSDGFDIYILPDTELTFNADGTLYFDDGFTADGGPVCALFTNIANESSSYDYDTLQLQMDGALGPFGPYQFIFTQQ